MVYILSYSLQSLMPVSRGVGAGGRPPTSVGKRSAFAGEIKKVFEHASGFEQQRHFTLLLAMN